VERLEVKHVKSCGPGIGHTTVLKYVCALVVPAVGRSSRLPDDVVDCIRIAGDVLDTRQRAERAVEEGGGGVLEYCLVQ
jgi:hypothetical protein